MISKKTRNRTNLETQIFSNIFVDSELKFGNTLKTKAFKNSLDKEVFEVLQKQFGTALLDKDFLRRYQEAHYRRNAG